MASSLLEVKYYLRKPLPRRISGFLVLLRTGTWTSYPVKVTSNFATKKINPTQRQAAKAQGATGIGSNMGNSN